MRRRLLVAALVGGVGVTVTTELASALGRFRRPEILALWAAGLGLGAILARVRAGSRRRARRPPEAPPRPAEAAVLASLAALLAATAIAALAAPPNTWDAMTYHMPRVEHWVQNANVDPFPTHNRRQVLYPPGAEYAIAQLRLLAGGDRLANLVQWASLAGCAVAASLVAGRLGAGRGGQLLAAAFALSVPMAILQASGAKNDLVVGFWLAASAFLAFDFDPRRPARDGLWVGAALGQALLTKFSAWILAPPLALWYATLVARRSRSRREAGLALLVTACAVVALNAPFAARTLLVGARADWSFAARPAPGASAARGVDVAPASAEPRTRAPDDSGRRIVRLPVRYVNQAWDLPALASNLLRNASLHLGTPVAGANAWLEDVVARTHRGLGISPNHPATTYPPGSYDGVGFSMHEDSAGSPVHFAMLLVVPVLLLGVRSPRRRWLREYALVVAAGALAFCALLKWQPWHARLHLPLFVLGAPLVGALVSQRLGHRGATALAAALTLLALPWLLRGEPRPLLGPGSVLATPRTTQLFRNRPELERPYRAAVARVAEDRCETVGLVLGGDDWEYPFWALFREASEGGAVVPRIEHVLVDGFTRRLERPGPEPFRPCAILATKRRDPELRFAGVRYRVSRDLGPVVVYRPGAEL